MTFLFVVVAGMFVGRLTRLVVDDTIVEPIRCRVVPKLPKFLQELVGCPWCFSGWAAIMVVVWYWVAYSLAMPLLIVGAVWWVSNACYWSTEFLAAKTIDSGEPIEIETDVKGFWERHEGES